MRNYQLKVESEETRANTTFIDYQDKDGNLVLTENGIIVSVIINQVQYLIKDDQTFGPMETLDDKWDVWDVHNVHNN